MHQVVHTLRVRPYDHRWQQMRQAVLLRDDHACQIRGPQCVGVATHVDHIVPLSEGGQRLDPANLRAACAVCNLSRVAGRARLLAEALNRAQAAQPSRQW